MNNLQQIKFLARVARMAGYATLQDMFWQDRELFERAARRWRQRH